MPSTCFNLAGGTLLRVTRLDDCGNYPAPETADSFVVTDGWVSVQVSPDYEDGDEYIQPNANGDLCINDRGRDVFKRTALTATLCGVNPGLFSIVTGATLNVDSGGTNIGYRMGEGMGSSNFALEMWANIAGQPCDAAGARCYDYVLFPWVRNGRFGDFTVQNDVVTFELTAWTQGNSPWGSGPYDVVDVSGSPAPLVDPVTAGDHMLSLVSCAPLPTVDCDMQPMPAVV